MPSGRASQALAGRASKILSMTTFRAFPDDIARTRVAAASAGEGGKEARRTILASGKGASLGISFEGAVILERR